MYALVYTNIFNSIGLQKKFEKVSFNARKLPPGRILGKYSKLVGIIISDLFGYPYFLFCGYLPIFGFDTCISAVTCFNRLVY